MKKTLIFVSMIILASFALSACAGGLERRRADVSEYRDNAFEGQSASFKATAVSGYREDPFAIDGVSGEKCDFCLVTIEPNDFDPIREYNYKLSLGDEEYEGTLNKHPFENTYSFEVKARVQGDFSVEIDGELIEFTSVKTEEFITPEKAFDIAYKRLADCKVVKDGGYEIYVRLIANPVNAEGGYFWYVAFVNENRETAAVLIDPIGLDIVAVRE